MSCCPTNAWGNIGNPDYKEKGQVDKIDDIEIYRVGQGSRCIIWNYDVFGFNGNRTRQMCDFLADHGFMVLLPDYFRGDSIDPTKIPTEKVGEFVRKVTKWESLKSDWLNKIKPYAESHGAKTFGAVGACWGSYMTLRLSGFVEFKAGVSVHPSHPKMWAGLNEDPVTVLKAVKCNQLYMPAGGDHPDTFADGNDKKVLNDALKIVPFPDMVHGWTVRGDMSIPEVKRDVEKCYNLMVAFLKF